MFAGHCVDGGWIVSSFPRNAMMYPRHSMYGISSTIPWKVDMPFPMECLGATLPQSRYPQFLLRPNHQSCYCLLEQAHAGAQGLGILDL